MAKNRKIVDIAIGYIIGIIWGLYFNKSIVLLYFIMFLILLIIKFTKLSRFTKYLKLVIKPNAVILIIAFSIISSLIVKRQNNQYENLYSNVGEVTSYMQVIDNGISKEYKSKYKVKVKNLNNNTKFKDTYLYINVQKQIKLEYGDYILVKGEFDKPNINTNYKGFNYKEYLKTVKIFGTVNVTSVDIIDKNTGNILLSCFNRIFLNIKDKIYQKFEGDTSSVLIGILFGNTDNIDEQIIQNFSDSNISHVLAVSGMHISYILLGVSFLGERILGKRNNKIFTILFLLMYLLTIGFLPSAYRATIMAILILISKLIHRKNDIWTSLAISALILLIYNPFLIKSISFLLSYFATIGIILFQKNILNIFKSIKIRKTGHIYRPKYVINRKLGKILNYVYETLSVSFAAQIAILPILLINFNSFGITFFITNFFVSLIIGPIIILGFILILISFIRLDVLFKLEFSIEILINMLLKISEVSSKLEFSKLLVSTPKIWQVLLYYILIILINFIYTVFIDRTQNVVFKRFKNYIYLFKYKLHKNKIIIIFCFILIIFFNLIFSIVPNELKIYFIDVGQGDSTLIITPNNNNILVDGGGSLSFDVGGKTLLPYLLDRNVKNIDYMIISHFDNDHVRTDY